ncbi:hypothetical protein KIN20_014674 [Parelaphostrongylus tenuis]|uniref:Protein kinase domain-containing protein n=1 Tax=Parelaphostrongylus tenuis TaxID=148309 RepID=A0AAD5QS23_PARTN|nr:hypothetical protein KIN20_014674 [Parelaphostrongylus tenuis]
MGVSYSDIEQGQLLGKGAYGEVRAGRVQLKTGENVEVAIKVAIHMRAMVLCVGYDK